MVEVATRRVSPKSPRDRRSTFPILSLRGLRIPQKQLYINALNIYASSAALDFEDALAIAHMDQNDIVEIVSYDQDFDSVPEIIRIEPQSTKTLLPPVQLHPNPLSSRERGRRLAVQPNAP